MCIRDSRRAECEPVAARIDRHCVAIDDVVGVSLRQAVRQNVEALAAIARARDHHPAIAGDVLDVYKRQVRHPAAHHRQRL